MLANLLPGLRNIRAPLSAGYILVIAGWFIIFPRFPAKEQATGIASDLYELSTFAGKTATLAAVTFAAYLAGVISVELTRIVLATLNGIPYLAFKIIPDRYKDIANRAGNRMFPLSPGGSSTRARREAIETVVIRRLSLRHQQDETFREEVGARLSTVYDEAERIGGDVSGIFRGRSVAEVRDDMIDRAPTRIRVLTRLIDIRGHAEDLLWESRFTEAGAATTQTLLEERDRSKAEAEFRKALALPVSVLAIVLAYRGSPWFLTACAISVWLLYMGAVMDAEADGVVLKGIAQGRLDWPAVEQLSTGRIYYRPLADIT